MRRIEVRLILIVINSREIGWYETGWVWSLFGLGRRIVLDSLNLSKELECRKTALSTYVSVGILSGEYSAERPSGLLPDEHL